LRPRVRAALADADGTGPAVAALCKAAYAAGAARAEQEVATAAILAERAVIRPEGFALLSPGPLDPAALAALIQTVAGAAFPPPTASVAALAAAPRPATLSGVRLLPAGRLGNGFLLVREARAMQPAIPARPGAVWDGRFRLHNDAILPEDATIGALGADAARLRRRTPLPAAVLWALPALRRANSLVTVPHLLYPDPAACAAVPLVFSPRRPAASTPFLPIYASGRKAC
jgi:tRNA(Ile)-lysidine synthase